MSSTVCVTPGGFGERKWFSDTLVSDRDVQILYPSEC